MRGVLERELIYYLFWIFSISSINSFLRGDHTEFAYSRCGLTKDLYIYEIPFN